MSAVGKCCSRVAGNCCLAFRSSAVQGLYLVVVHLDICLVDLDNGLVDLDIHLVRPIHLYGPHSQAVAGVHTPNKCST
uniref:Uncharacterized protein n=1 Tax=Ciona savignyi TaxID=51511 RepID=H2YGK2_CIOSA